VRTAIQPPKTRNQPAKKIDKGKCQYTQKRKKKTPYKRPHRIRKKAEEEENANS
jgi:hypothetical protein